MMLRDLVIRLFVVVVLLGQCSSTTALDGFDGPMDSCFLTGNTEYASVGGVSKSHRVGIAEAFNSDDSVSATICNGVITNPSQEPTCGKNAWEDVATVDDCAEFCVWLNDEHVFRKLPQLPANISHTFGCGAFTYNVLTKSCAPRISDLKGLTYAEIEASPSGYLDTCTVKETDFLYVVALPKPSVSPTKSPTSAPVTTAPSPSPTSSKPTLSPSRTPSLSPTTTTPTPNPTIAPTLRPSTSAPTPSPSVTPTVSPATSIPTSSPTTQPPTGSTPPPTTASPTPSPTAQPSANPTSLPSQLPSTPPTRNPTFSPSTVPTQIPTSSAPSSAPTTSPTSTPTVSPTINPTVSPSVSPTTSPTISPSISPTSSPTRSPSRLPTLTPTSSTPTTSPTTSTPTVTPTKFPTVSTPTTSPSQSPSTSSPSLSPTISPTFNPPTAAPTLSPSSYPTQLPTFYPTSSEPTASPTTSPSRSPSVSPTQFPTTSLPSSSPSTSPTAAAPTLSPTLSPSSSTPTMSPTVSPTSTSPTTSPTSSPTTASPSISPTRSPTTASPSTSPTASPTLGLPTSSPTISPSSSSPTMSPSASPSISTPTSSPTTSPTTSTPTTTPTVSPTMSPTVTPTQFPSTSPTPQPTNFPSVPPTRFPTLTPTVSTSVTTTQTTSATSTQTSTATSTQTTTPVTGKIICEQINGDQYLAIDENEDCELQVAALNEMVSECTSARGTFRRGRLSCDSTFGFNAIVAGTNCVTETRELNSMLNEFSFGDGGSYDCSLTGYLKNDIHCGQDTLVLNNAVTAYIAGEFTECQATTATTSGTTTATTTAVADTLILYFADLDCGFLGSPARTTDFHTNVGNAISQICLDANGMCALQSATSSCGSVVTELNVGVTQQLSGAKAVGDVVTSAIKAGVLKIKFEGATLSQPQVFPLRRNVSIGYAGSLSLVARTDVERVELETAISNAVRLHLTQIFGIQESSALVDTSNSTVKTFDYVMTLLIETVSDFNTYSDFDEQLLAAASLLSVNFTSSASGSTSVLLTPLAQVATTTTTILVDVTSPDSNNNSAVKDWETAAIVAAVVFVLFLIGAIVYHALPNGKKPKSKGFDVTEETKETGADLEDWWNRKDFPIPAHTQLVQTPGVGFRSSVSHHGASMDGSSMGNPVYRDVANRPSVTSDEDYRHANTLAHSPDAFPQEQRWTQDDEPTEWITYTRPPLPETSRKNPTADPSRNDPSRPAIYEVAVTDTTQQATPNTDPDAEYSKKGSALYDKADPSAEQIKIRIEETNSVFGDTDNDEDNTTFDDTETEDGFDSAVNALTNIAEEKTNLEDDFDTAYESETHQKLKSSQQLVNDELEGIAVSRADDTDDDDTREDSVALKELSHGIDAVIQFRKTTSNNAALSRQARSVHNALDKVVSVIHNKKRETVPAEDEEDVTNATVEIRTASLGKIPDDNLSGNNLGEEKEKFPVRTLAKTEDGHNTLHITPRVWTEEDDDKDTDNDSVTASETGAKLEDDVQRILPGSVILNVKDEQLGSRDLLYESTKLKEQQNIE
eukprot:m.232611 g.232611  ORF g.232611 m.232611 type:complete len:1542 (-) comp33625_c0_seq1:112-4737(-)